MDTPEEEMWRTKRKGRAEPGSYRTWTEKGSLGLSTSEETATKVVYRIKQSIKIQQQLREGIQDLPFKHSQKKTFNSFVKKMSGFVMLSVQQQVKFIETLYLSGSLRFGTLR